MLTKLYRLEHSTYVCQYHIVWIPRYRGKVLADTYIKQELKRIFKFICKWKGFTIVAWHIGDDHIHLYLIIPPKYSVSYSIQVLKSKSANWLKKKTKRFPQGNLWARGYFVSTIGINEQVIINYIKNQDHKRVDIENMKLF
jgi:putative transposase